MSDENTQTPKAIELKHTGCRTGKNVTTRYKAAFAELALAYDQLERELAAARKDSEAKWNNGIPEVTEGRMERFWCATLSDSGKVFHRHLCYANKHPMPLNDYSDTVPDCAEPIEGDENNYAWTGWYEESCDQCETQWQFSRKVIAWTSLPKYAAAIAAQQGEGRGK